MKKSIYEIRNEIVKVSADTLKYEYKKRIFNEFYNKILILAKSKQINSISDLYKIFNMACMNENNESIFEIQPPNIGWDNTSNQEVLLAKDNKTGIKLPDIVKKLEVKSEIYWLFNWIFEVNVFKKPINVSNEMFDLYNECNEYNDVFYDGINAIMSYHQRAEHAKFNEIDVEECAKILHAYRIRNLFYSNSIFADPNKKLTSNELKTCVPFEYLNVEQQDIYRDIIKTIHNVIQNLEQRLVIDNFDILDIYEEFLKTREKQQCKNVNQDDIFIDDIIYMQNSSDKFVILNKLLEQYRRNGNVFIKEIDSLLQLKKEVDSKLEQYGEIIDIIQGKEDKDVISQEVVDYINDYIEAEYKPEEGNRTKIIDWLKNKININRKMM